MIVQVGMAAVVFIGGGSTMIVTSPAQHPYAQNISVPVYEQSTGTWVTVSEPAPTQASSNNSKTSLSDWGEFLVGLGAIGGVGAAIAQARKKAA